MTPPCSPSRHATHYAVTARSTVKHEPCSANNGDHENTRQKHQKKRHTSGSAPPHYFATVSILRTDRSDRIDLGSLIVNSPEPVSGWSLDRTGLYGSQPLHRRTNSPAIQRAGQFTHPASACFLILPTSRPCQHLVILAPNHRAPLLHRDGASPSAASAP